MQTSGLYKGFQASHAWWDGHPSRDITQNPLMDFLAPKWFFLVVCLRVLRLGGWSKILSAHHGPVKQFETCDTVLDKSQPLPNYSNILHVYKSMVCNNVDGLPGTRYDMAFWTIGIMCVTSSALVIKDKCVFVVNFNQRLITHHLHSSHKWDVGRAEVAPISQRHCWSPAPWTPGWI